MTGSPLDAFDLPPPWPDSLLPSIHTRNEASGTHLVVLDNKTLGGQCVHDVPVLTSWEPNLLATELECSPAFLLLTNTRALARPKAIERAWAVGAALRAAEATTGRTVTPIWRSDSTLRGHYYWEMQAFESAFRGDNVPEPVYVFLPYFGDGGRVTLNDTQYVLLHEDALLPVAETEFARDPAFPYTDSHLPSWLEAHSNARFRATEVRSISHTDLRVGGPERVAALLASAPAGSAVIVNASADRDLEVFVAGLRIAEATGTRCLCSGTASFVRARAGQNVHPLLSPEDMGPPVASQHAGKLREDMNGTGGLTIVGSYVDKTSSQLAHAIARPDIVAIELSVEALATPETRGVEEQRIATGISNRLAAGEDVVLHTSRRYVDEAASRIADALAGIIEALVVPPRYLLVKGGSTASHLATGVLGVRRALVLGQLLPGVPVWRLDEESRWPGLPFVIFAGNVGVEESLSEALQRLRGS